MRFRGIHSAEDIISLVQEIGFLPFFRNEIEGFSIADLCAPELWMSDDIEGPWEWKGPIARTKTCVYGKFFAGRAGYISTEWFPDFANYRRDGYDFDARFDDELASYKDKGIYDVIAENGEILSKTLKEKCNYRKGGNKGFDTVITRLQMQTYVNIADFVYLKDRFGQTYGWGVAQYSTPEAMFGREFVTSAYHRDPEESKEKILVHLRGLLPDASEKQIRKMLG